MNPLLYPTAMKFKRRHKLSPKQYQYLEGCVRKDKPFQVPRFNIHNEKPLIYVSFGSLGAGDIDLLKRVIAALGKMEVRALVNVGDYIGQYSAVPENVHIATWFPQPSVIPKVDAVIHHGGNNSFTECLYFGKPAIIMPYVWDGHDNATRVQEKGHGFKLDRYNWSEEELAAKVHAALTDKKMKSRLKKTSKHMRAHPGTAKAAKIIEGFVRKKAKGA